MPTLVRTPEEVLRETGHDLVFLRFHDGIARHQQGLAPSGYLEISDWLSTHLPHVCLELLGPSEFSGVLCGGIGEDYAIVGARDGDISTYASTWENADGYCIDGRWQAYIYPTDEYEQRLKKHPAADGSFER